MSWKRIFNVFELSTLLNDWYYTMFGTVKPYSVKEYLIRNVNLILQHHKELGIPNFRNGPYDTQMLNILSWTIDNFKYVKDSVKFNQSEMWEDAIRDDGLGFAQTLTGDCESGATLMLAMGILSGISAEQLRFWCGRMSDGQGHATLKYRADYDMNTYAIDWCYYPDKTSIKQRKTFSELERYKTKWFEVTTLE